MKTMGMLLAGVLLSAAAPSWAHEDVAVAQPQGEQRDAAVNDPRPVDDAPQLRQSIQAALQREATLKNQRVDVVLRRCRVDQTSQRCNVTLTGTVDTQAARATAERVARVKGVVLIDNRLELADTTADLVP